MTPSEERRYRRFSEMSGVEMHTAATGLDELLRDPGTRRCFDEVVTGEKPLTIDGMLACYGEANDELTDDEQRAYRGGFRRGRRPDADREDADRGRLAGRRRRAKDPIPGHRHRAWAPIPRRRTRRGRPPERGCRLDQPQLRGGLPPGFATERDLDEKLYAWLSESSSARADSGSDWYISGAPRPNGQLHTLHRMPGSAPEIVALRALS